MKKLCWFCDRVCDSFISICEPCREEKKKMQQKNFLASTSRSQLHSISCENHRAINKNYVDKNYICVINKKYE